MLARIGRAGDASLIDAQIKQIPVAFDKVTGKFSEKQFTQFLASQGLTPRQVQNDLADELASHFPYPPPQGSRPRGSMRRSARSPGFQYRDVSYFLLDQRAVVPPAPPTDADLTAFMKANASQLTLPEMRTVTLARFSAAALAPSVTVSEADIQKEFNFRKDSLSTPETRDIVQIPVRTAADGAQAAQRLTRGDDPAAIARSFGVEPVLYTGKPKLAIPDPKIAAAAFAMTQGQVNGPVQGDLGWAALKVVKVTPAKVATLDSARAKIESDLRLKAAQNQAYALSQKFDDAKQGGARLVAAAQKAGVVTMSLGPFSAEGVDMDGKPITVLNDKIVKSAFAMKSGEESDVQDAGPGEYYALKVEQVLAPALPPLDRIRGKLADAYVRQKLSMAMRAKADSLMADLKQGKAMDGLAVSVGTTVIHQQGLQLVQAAQYKALGREFLTSIFSQKPGAVFASGAPDGIFIARLDAIRPGDVTTTARFLEAVRARASEDYLRDLLDATKAAAQQSVKVNIDLALARRTLGVDVSALSGPKGGGLQ